MIDDKFDEDEEIIFEPEEEEKEFEFSRVPYAKIYDTLLNGYEPGFKYYAVKFPGEQFIMMPYIYFLHNGQVRNN